MKAKREQAYELRLVIKLFTSNYARVLLKGQCSILDLLHNQHH